MIIIANTSLHNGTKSELVSAKLSPCSVPKTICSPAADSILYHDENQYGAGRDHKIADRSDHRSENVIEHRVLEVSRIDRCRLGPSENGQVGEHGNCRQDERPEQVNVLDGIERNPTQHARGGIAAQVGHPCVCRFVNADRKHESDQLEHDVQDVNMLQVHARLVLILTRGAAVPRGPRR